MCYTCSEYRAACRHGVSLTCKSTAVSNNTTSNTAVDIFNRPRFVDSAFVLCEYFEKVGLVNR